MLPIYSVFDLGVQKGSSISFAVSSKAFCYNSSFSFSSIVRSSFSSASLMSSNDSTFFSSVLISVAVSAHLGFFSKSQPGPVSGLGSSQSLSILIPLSSNLHVYSFTTTLGLAVGFFIKTLPAPETFLNHTVNTNYPDEEL